MEKTKVDINILGQDISVMCTEEEKSILLKSRDKIIDEGRKGEISNKECWA
jgi:cell division protein ZapA (FtsZ GTPase activity inhibitor)